MIYKKDKFKNYYAFDVETTGLDTFKAKIFSYCICDSKGRTKVYRIDGSSRERKENIKILKDFFLDTKKIKVCHNYHYEYNMLMNDGVKRLGLTIPEDTKWEDTMLMSRQLRNLAPSHRLDDLAWELFGFTKDNDKEVKKLRRIYGGYKNIPEPVMHKYQLADGIRTMLLFQLFYEDIYKDERVAKNYGVELDIIKASYKMEKYGLLLNIKTTEKLISELDDKIIKNNNEVYQLLGNKYNLGSDKDVIRILFNILKLPVLNYTKKGNISVNKDTVFELKKMYPDNKFLDLILKHRSYTHGKSLLKSYIKFADKNGLIHPNIKTSEAKTGRESSSKPNLNSISKKNNLKSPFAVPARKCFRARPNHYLAFADYAQIELRLMIELSGDETMINILAKGGDVHHEAMCCFFGFDKTNDLMERDRVKYKELRSATKNAHFGLAYGANIATVAESLRLTVDEFKKGYNRYKDRHESIVNLLRTKTKEAKDNGFITTIFGRKLFVDLSKPYVGLNYFIQGSAAELFKRGQVRVDKYLEEYAPDVHLMLPNHDEIFISIPKYYDVGSQKFKTLQTDINTLMTAHKEIKTPLDLEWKITKTVWDEAVEID